MISYKLYEYRQQILDRMDKYHVVTDPSQYHKLVDLYAKLIDEEHAELNEAKDNKFPLDHIIKEVIDLYWVSVGYGYWRVLTTGNEDHPDILMVRTIEDNFMYLSDTALLYKCLDAVIASNNTKIVPDHTIPSYDPTQKIQKGPNYVAPDLKSIINEHVKAEMKSFQDTNGEA